MRMELPLPANFIRMLAVIPPAAMACWLLNSALIRKALRVSSMIVLFCVTLPCNSGSDEPNASVTLSPSFIWKASSMEAKYSAASLSVSDRIKSCVPDTTWSPSLIDTSVIVPANGAFTTYCSSSICISLALFFTSSSRSSTACRATNPLARSTFCFSSLLSISL